MTQSRIRPIKHLKMTVKTLVLWKINTHMAKKWPEKVVQRSFIKGHSFPYRLYYQGRHAKFLADKSTKVAATSALCHRCRSHFLFFKIKAGPPISYPGHFEICHLVKSFTSGKETSFAPSHLNDMAEKFKLGKK